MDLIEMRLHVVQVMLVLVMKTEKVACLLVQLAVAQSRQQQVAVEE
jgi:hypothetical protein